MAAAAAGARAGVRGGGGGGGGGGPGTGVGVGAGGFGFVQARGSERRTAVRLSIFDAVALHAASRWLGLAIPLSSNTVTCSPTITRAQRRIFKRAFISPASVAEALGHIALARPSRSSDPRSSRGKSLTRRTSRPPGVRLSALRRQMDRRRTSGECWTRVSGVPHRVHARPLYLTSDCFPGTRPRRANRAPRARLPSFLAYLLDQHLSFAAVSN
jgi:hypothetical protein